MKSAVVLRHLVVGVACGVAFACTGPAAGEAIYTNGEVTVGADTSKPGGNGTTSSSTSSSGGGAGDPFFRNVTYNYDERRPLQNADDNNTGTHAGKIPLAGKDCATAGCHLDKGPKWVMSGTVYSKQSGGTPVPKVQVGIVTPDNRTITDCYTDAQGNFWLEGDTPLAAGSKVAVRKDATSPSQPMISPVPAPPAGGACNSGGCHGETNRIFVN